MQPSVRKLTSIRARALERDEKGEQSARMNESNRLSSHGTSRSPAHEVLFFDDPGMLTRGVFQYLREGLEAGEPAVVIATEDHCRAFVSELERDGILPRHSGLLTCLDAEETLTRFMATGRPDPKRFQNSVGRLIEDLSPGRSGGRLRAYGEMVNLLWASGHSGAAAELEHLWNRLLGAHGFRLLCAYAIDVFSREFQPAVVDDVLRSHTHILAGARETRLCDALNRASEEVLGHRPGDPRSAAGLRPSWAAMSEAHARILCLRSNLRERSEEVLSRARQYFLASEARV